MRDCGSCSDPLLLLLLLPVLGDAVNALLTSFNGCSDIGNDAGSTFVCTNDHADEIIVLVVESSNDSVLEVITNRRCCSRAVLT